MPKLVKKSNLGFKTVEKFTCGCVCVCILAARNATKRTNKQSTVLYA